MPLPLEIIYYFPVLSMTLSLKDMNWTELYKFFFFVNVIYNTLIQILLKVLPGNNHYCGFHWNANSEIHFPTNDWVFPCRQS